MVDPLLIYSDRAGLSAGQGDGDLLSEPKRIRPIEERPVPDDRLRPGFDEGRGGDPGALPCVHVLLGRQQVPELVVPPERERDRMVDVEVLRVFDRLPGPDAGERAGGCEPVQVHPSGVQYRAFGLRDGAEPLHHQFGGDCPGPVGDGGECRPPVQDRVLAREEIAEVLEDREDLPAEGEGAGM